jgi:hypothetical protein
MLGQTMSEQEQLVIKCEMHGERIAAVMCCHLLNSEQPLGIIENSDDPLDLQAWCHLCEHKYLEEGDRTDAFNEFTDMKMVCDCCYSIIKSRHNLIA